MGTGDTNSYRIGADATAGVPLSGEICEVVVFNAALSSGDRTSMLNYLSAKWGIAIAAMGWWTASTAVCVGAWDAIGAASLAASKVNLATGINLSNAVGVDPAHALGTGWTFDGSTQYIPTPFQSGPTQSALIRFRNGASPAGLHSVFCSSDGAVGGFQIFQNYTGGHALSVHGGAASWIDVPGEGMTTAGDVVALTPEALYKNGHVIGTAAQDWSGVTPAFPDIGASNDNGTPGEFWQGDILAVAVYDGTLSAPEIATISARMNGLPEQPSRRPIMRARTRLGLGLR